MVSIGSLYSTLSADELLEKVIPYYQIGKVKNCILWESGFNDTYKIEGESKDYILRVYRFGRRTLDDIEFEIEVLLHLKSKSVSVSYPLERIDEKHITSISTAEGLRYVIVTNCAQGKPFAYDTLDEAFLYGKHVAMVHKATEGFYSTRKRQILNEEFLIEAPLASIESFSGVSPEHIEYINQLSSRLSVCLGNMNSSELDYGFCHGDFHGWNAHALLSDVEFFDFDFCGFGLRAYELSVFRWSARLGGKEKERWEEFISGYRSIRSIKDVDLELTTIFMAIRDIWLIGQHIDNTKVFGRNWMNIDYFDKRIKFLKELESEIFSA